MVFQNNAPYPHMKVAENIGFSLKLAKVGRAEIDRKVREAAEIKELHQRLQTTIVYVTQDPIEAMTMAEKIVVMKDGFVEQTGAPLVTTRERITARTGDIINLSVAPGKLHCFDAESGVRLRLREAS